jgi:tartrate-resistant acid phosphatase type 5
MRLKGFFVALIAAAYGCEADICRADETAGVVPVQSALDLVAAKLPQDVADAARKWLNEDNKELRAMLAYSSGDLEQHVMEELAGDKEAAGFVLGRMESEPPATDMLIVRKIAVDEFWVDQPGVTDSLEKLARSASDPDLMLAYLDTERRVEVKRLRRILTARIDAARQSGDSTELDTLAKADERWLLTERGAALPGFMRKPPALFTVNVSGDTVRVVGMGDFGSGSSAQKDVAAAIVRMGAAKPFDLGLTFGDNFYPSGMTGTDDPRWRDWWESLYSPLGVRFYPSLGNHEWYSDDGAAAEIAYRSPTWFFPSPYYTFTAGPVQFFAIDTTELSEAEVLWLDKAITASTARWKVVYGHHPIFAPERDAKSGEYMKYMQKRLWPIIRGRVDAYLCGHQHAMAHMDPVDGVHFFMSGGGGAALGRVSKKAEGTLFAESKFGFLTLEANAATMTISIFDTDGNAFAADVIAR